MIGPNDKASGAAARSETPFLGLNRPQYAAIPEMLLSALAWHAALATGEGGRAKHLIDGREFDALVFEHADDKQPKSFSIGRTLPPEGSERRSAMANALATELHLEQARAASVVEILLEDLKALRPPKAKEISATPLSLEASLLQDAPGLARARNPANYAAIIERMNVLGSGKTCAAAGLVNALSARGSGNPAWLDDAIGAMTPPALKEAAERARDWAAQGPGVVGRPPAWLIDERQTPYAWFARTWKTLTTGGWIERMPRRRWVDWSACVLRTALGAGYLFEMNLVYHLAAAVASDEPEEDVVQRALARNEPLLSWDERARVSSRDVRGRVRLVAQRGTSCLELLRRWRKSNEDEANKANPFPDPTDFDDRSDGLEAWIRAARTWRDRAGADLVRAQVAASMEVGNVPTPAKNVDETIMYALRARVERPGTADLYGLLRTRGRYAIVDPGQEWFVAISSLAVGAAGATGRVADVEDAFRAIGLRPGFPVIVERLELSGLARSSHDADEAIELATAF